MKAEALNTPAFDQFERATLKLHELIREGRDASPEAEQIREYLFDPWEQMTPDQRDFGTGLSADLYVLNASDGEVLEPVSDEERSPQRLGLAIPAAWRRRDWPEVLVLLRKGPAFFPQSHIAYLRARAHDELGRPAVALAFIRHARTLDPANATYKVLEIELLRKLEDSAAALELARHYIDEEAVPAKLSIYAAGVVFESTRTLPEAEAKELWAKLARGLHGVLGAAITEAPSSFVSGCVLLGACYDGLGEPQAALESYRTALRFLHGSDDQATYAALQAYVAERFPPPSVATQKKGPLLAGTSSPAARREALFALMSAVSG